MQTDYLILVNKENPLPEGFCPDICQAENGVFLETEAAKAYIRMKSAAEKDGINLRLLSGYRSISYQQKLLEKGIKERILSGMSPDAAELDAGHNIAPPGSSEHNTGLALDIVRPEDDDVYEEFEETEQFGWLLEKAADFGFILRYPKDAAHITGYVYEPWHYRFVNSFAKEIKNYGKTLEEYLTYYKKCGKISCV